MLLEPLEKPTIDTAFKLRDPSFEDKVRSSFACQQAMKTSGIKIAGLAPGFIVLTMPYAKAFTQQHGFIRAGVITTTLDRCPWLCGVFADEP